MGGIEEENVGWIMIKIQYLHEILKEKNVLKRSHFQKQLTLGEVCFFFFSSFPFYSSLRVQESLID